MCLPFRILECNKSLGLINLFLPKILSTFMLRKQTQFLSVIICECLVIWRENWKFTKVKLQNLEMHIVIWRENSRSDRSAWIFSKIVFFWFRKTGGGHWMTGWDICRTLWFDEKIHVLTDMSITKMVSLNSSDSEKLVVVIDMFWNLPLNPELIHVLTEMSINVHQIKHLNLPILNLFHKLCYSGLHIERF